MSGKDQYPVTVHLTSRDVPRSIAFYRDKLGFELKECWPDEENPMFAGMRLNGQSVLLGGHVAGDELAKWIGDDKPALVWSEKYVEEYEASTPGAGVTVYLAVEDVDAYHTTLKERGVKQLLEPKTQFYGQRDFPVLDPEGYRLTFYTPIKMESCQSCGMPLTDATAGQMYCGYCSDEHGNLKPYEVVLEGTIQGYFMGMQKMERSDAEVAAKEHLSGMPAWTSRGK